MTEHRVKADVSLVRDFFNRRMTFPDGSEHEMWTFTDAAGHQNFPAPLVRAREGQVVHVELRPSKRRTRSTGTGSSRIPATTGSGTRRSRSREATPTSGGRTQAVPGDPNQGAAGTYFYHCHVNTVLHVQMGMVGPMVIDPIEHPDFPVPDGARRPFVDGPLYDVASEHLLVPYALDSRWHELSHAAGLSGEDVGLNRFEPDHFFILGGNVAEGGPPDAVWSSEVIRVNAEGHGHPSLLRLLNLNYFPVVMTFSNSARTRALPFAELIGHDGRPYRDTSFRQGRSPTPNARGGAHQLVTQSIAFGAAERYDVLLHPAPGRYTLRVDFHHWIPARERDGARPQQPRILATQVDRGRSPLAGVPPVGWQRHHHRPSKEPTLTEWILLGTALLLIAACGVFVAAEFAFVTVDRSKVDQAAAEGDAGAIGVQRALRSLSTQLSGAQVGITVTNLAIGYLAEPAIAELIDGPLEALGHPAVPSAWSP